MFSIICGAGIDSNLQRKLLAFIATQEATLLQPPCGVGVARDRGSSDLPRKDRADGALPLSRHADLEKDQQRVAKS
jgi:hypothetical protein